MECIHLCVPETVRVLYLPRYNFPVVPLLHNTQLCADRDVVFPAVGEPRYLDTLLEEHTVCRAAKVEHASMSA